MTRPVKAVLLRRIGRRGAFLAFLAFLDFVYAWAFWQIPGQPVLGPRIAWAIAWFIAGAACTIGVFLRKDRVPYTIASMTKTLFATQYCYLWVVRNVPYGWVSTVFWFVFALIVLMVSSWPDPVFTDDVTKRG